MEAERHEHVELHRSHADAPIVHSPAPGLAEQHDRRAAPAEAAHLVAGHVAQDEVAHGPEEDLSGIGPARRRVQEGAHAVRARGLADLLEHAHRHPRGQCRWVHEDLRHLAGLRIPRELRIGEDVGDDALLAGLGRELVPDGHAVVAAHAHREGVRRPVDVRHDDVLVVHAGVHLVHVAGPVCLGGEARLADRALDEDGAMPHLGAGVDTGTRLEAPRDSLLLRAHRVGGLDGRVELPRGREARADDDRVLDVPCEGHHRGT
eukprot:scaffold2601_cov198-Pinguiococcus_pyrenoidosus.AAC.1